MLIKLSEIDNCVSRYEEYACRVRKKEKIAYIDGDIKMEQNRNHSEMGSFNYKHVESMVTLMPFRSSNRRKTSICNENMDINVNKPYV